MGRGADRMKADIGVTQELPDLGLMNPAHPVATAQQHAGQCFECPDMADKRRSDDGEMAH